MNSSAEGGPPARYARYQRSMAALQRGLRALGFELLLEPDHQSRILIAVREPAESWYDFTRLHDALYAQGYTIYPGKAGRIPCFRLSVLGDIDERDIAGFVTALADHVEAARSRGVPPGPGARRSEPPPPRNGARPRPRRPARRMVARRR